MAWTNEQLTAIHKDGTNIIVSAGAGSGKTAVLSTRVVEKIKKGIHINELLILTFTNAAAGEMKERIKKKIKELNKPEELDLLESSYITTFDSFALSIVKKYHYILNIPKNIAITDSSILNLQKKKILDNILDKYYEEKTNEKFNCLVKDFCFKDDKSLKKSLLSLVTKLEIRTDRQEYMASYFNKYYQEKAINQYLSMYKDILRENIEALFLEVELQSNYFEKDYEQKVLDSISVLKKECSLDELIALINSVKIPISPRNSEEETKMAREKISDSLKNLKDLCVYGYQEEIIDTIKKTKGYLEIIFDILEEFFKQLQEYKNKYCCYDFNDIAQMSLKILRENNDIRDYLKHFFKEIMVDEYQDTSDIQEEFISLISNHNVYMVGDIKQSIYRFRNANPYIFKNKYDKYSLNTDGIKIDLLKNFRSRDEVLEDINTIFNPIMTNNIGNAEYTVSHQMVFGNTSYIEEGASSQNYHMDILEYEVKNKEFNKEEIEFFTIAQDIKKKIEQKYPIFDKDSKTVHDAKYEDFCLILDRNSSFDLAKKIFEYFEIPLCLYKDEVLNEDTDIYLFKNILTLLIGMKDKSYNDEFKYAFTSILRSYLFSKTDDEIFAYFNNKPFYESSLWQKLYPLSQKLNHLSLEEIAEEILSSLEFYNKTRLKGNVLESEIRFETILNIASNLGTLSYDIYDFKDYLKELLETNEKIKFNTGTNSSNAVKMMNIHKSKGLEFPVCYFCGLFKSFSKEDLKGNIIYDNTLPIYMPDRSTGIKESILKLLIQNKMIQEDVSEKIRLFYVALTRAKEKMILLLPKNENNVELKEDGIVYESIRKKYNSFASMLYSIPNTLKIYKKDIDVEALALTKNYLLKKDINQTLIKQGERIDFIPFHFTEQEVTRRSFSKKINQLLTPKEERNIELGLKVHKVFENINFKNFKPKLICDSFIKELAINLYQQDIFKDVKETTIFQEYEFIYNDDNTEKHGVIDLLIEHPSHIDIVDYKLSDVTDENYLLQLNGYKDYVQKKTNKPIHLYLYSILEKKLVEI